MKFVLCIVVGCCLGAVAFAQHRPQEPVPPFNYLSEEVRFPNEAAHIGLSGTFTRPKENKRYPTVITITGTGPQDRDEASDGHRPFAVIADHLSNRGMAVLRYDDRGTGSSSGKYKQADIFDFATDVQAAIRYLKTRPDVDTNAIGLLGHSEGAEVAQIVAAADKSVAFVISASGPGLKGTEIIMQQQSIIGQLLGLSDTALQKEISSNAAFFNILVSEKDPDEMRKKASAFLSEKYQSLSPEDRGNYTEAKYVKSLLKVQTKPEALSVLRFDPGEYLPRIQCPFLAIGGSKDIQLDEKANLDAIAANLRQGGNTQVTIKEFEGLNHVLQQCNTCKVEEYAALQQTIAPEVLDYLSDWIRGVVTGKK